MTSVKISVKLTELSNDNIISDLKMPRKPTTAQKQYELSEDLSTSVRSTNEASYPDSQKLPEKRLSYAGAVLTPGGSVEFMDTTTPADVKTSKKRKRHGSPVQRSTKFPNLRT